MIIEIPDKKPTPEPEYARGDGVTLTDGDYDTLKASVQRLEAKHNALSDMVNDYINSTKSLQVASMAPEFKDVDQLLREAIMSVIQSGSVLNKMLLEQKRDIIEMSMGWELASSPAGGYA